MAKVKEKSIRTNEAITAPKVRVIGVDGKQLGILSIQEARRLAEEAGLDLVEIAPQADPPVCRIMDYGKFLFEKSKKLQAAKKKQKQVQVKEIKMRPGTDEGDYQIKLRNMRRFLEDGDRVKVSLRFRGREITHPELGRRLLERVEKDLEDIAQVEQYPKMEGRQMIMLIVPKKR